jgi:hypothetical protein
LLAQRTQVWDRAMSVKCHEESHAPQQKVLINSIT